VSTPDPVLVADDVSVERGGLPVLRGVSLRVAPGEVVALLGGNGSGKSTLVRALLGLLPLRRGTIELFGRPVARFRGWSRVGYVPQRSTVNLSRAKVREVVASGRLSRRRPFLPASRDDRAAVSRALEVVGMADRSGDHLSELSGGQQQRVLIARALAGEPDLLVLDEPNAGVDLAHQRVLADLLGGLVASGTAVVVVLHEVGPLAGLIDRAVLLEGGRVTYDGPLDALVSGHAGHPHHAHPTEDDSVRSGLLDEPRLR
jgi:zinc transport system ATP-binding protein